MARSRWKLAYFSKSIWRKIIKLIKKKRFRKRITYDRASCIPKRFLYRQFRIHKGRRGRSIYIRKFMVFKKFGEFSFTRKPYHFPAKKSRKK